MMDWSTRVVAYVGVAAVMAGAITTYQAVAAAAAPLIDCVSADNGDPELIGLSFTPAVVDVSDGPAEVTVRATVADTGGPGEPSGVARMQVELDRRGFSGDSELMLEPEPGGEWVTTLTVGRWDRQDQWRLTEVELLDRARNEGLYGYGGEDLGVVPGAQVLTVVNDRPDLTRPRIIGADFTPSRVRTVHGTRFVRFTVRASDTGSGVARVAVGLYRERGAGSATAVLRQLPGMPRRFRGRVAFDAWAGAGRWRVEYIAVWDRAFNSRLVQSPPALRRLGVGGDLTVVSRRDDIPPRISGLSLIPEITDVRTTDQSVTVSMRVRDRHAGVRRVLAYLTDPLELNPIKRLRLVSGNMQDGMWEGTIRVRQCPARSGRMRAFVFAADRQGNRSFYGPRQLRDRGWPWQVRLLARPDAVIDPYGVVHPPRVSPAGPFSLTFPEIVNGITAGSALLRRVTPRREGSLPGPAVPGTWTCTDDKGVPTDCAVGRVREASFSPTSPLAARRAYAVVLNPEHTLAATDLAGNPYDRSDYLFRVGVS
jgi:hypothetical protein